MTAAWWTNPERGPTSAELRQHVVEGAAAVAPATVAHHGARVLCGCGEYVYTVRSAATPALHFPPTCPSCGATVLP